MSTRAYVLQGVELSKSCDQELDPSSVYQCVIRTNVIGSRALS